jgi:hypothetical protein
MSTALTPYRDFSHTAPNGSVLCALINGDLGWLMYLREYGDAGFSSRNPEYDGPADTKVNFKLDNGQMDEYPRAWCYPVDIVERALKHFVETGLPPTFICWHNDSGDGASIAPSTPRHGERSGRAR